MYIHAYDSSCVGNRMISSETSSQAHKLLHHHLGKTSAQEHKRVAVTRPKWSSAQLLGGAAVFGATQMHVKQLLHCSVLQLGVNKDDVPSAQHMRCTLQQFGCSFISVVWLSLPRGRKPPGDKQGSSGGQLLFSFNLVFPYFSRLHFVLSVFSSI